MPITDQTILSEIQRVSLEGVGDGGATWPSTMWTQAEVLGYLNQRQNRFLNETGIRWTRLETAITTGQANQATPTDWITTIFIAYKSAAGLYKELPRLDVSELDFALPNWPGTSTASAPKGYDEVDGDTLNTYVYPVPTDVGSALERYYVALGTALTAGGVNFSVPDEFVPAIKYGCLAEMFGKVGPTQNLVLAAMCEERWQECVEIAKTQAVEGWFLL